MNILPLDLGMGADKKLICFLSAALFLFILAALPADLSAQQSKADAAKQDKKQESPKIGKSLEEERMSIIKADIQKAIDEYKKLKAEADKSIKAADEKNQEKLTNIAKMFESMPAEEAARRMEKLDDSSALVILKALKPKSAGKILAQMETERAAALSKKMIPVSALP